MTSPSDEPQWLTVEDVKQLHRRSIERFGGSPGILDERILESAVMTPQQSAFGVLAHRTLGAQAAAYLYHITKGHAFEDGNKRTGLLACEAFLGLNGKELSFSDREAYDLTMRVASSTLGKEQLTDLLERNLLDLGQAQALRAGTIQQAGPAVISPQKPTYALSQETAHKQRRGHRRGM